MSMQDKIKALEEKRQRLQQGGGEAKIKKQHEAGKLTARERINTLCDENSFREMALFATHRCTNFGMADKEFPGEGVVTGYGKVDGRAIHLASQDFTVVGGAAGETHSDKVADMMQAALKTGTPFIFINDSGGARVQEGIDSLAAYGRIFYNNVNLSGVVPQISLILGPCAGGAAYSPALTDFVIQCKGSQMFITGPSVIKQVTGEVITQEELGGAAACMTKAGNIHFVAENDEHAIGICKHLLSFLPSNNLEDAPVYEFSGDVPEDPSLREILPEDTKRPYDVREVITRVVDNGDFLEVQPEFAMNIVVGFGRFGGKSAGIIANQPMTLAGALDIDASDKAAHFIRFCNAFNIPVITFVDIPGYMPGIRQEHGGIIRHGAKMLFAYSAATVPKITIVLRKAYGGSFLAMCSKDLGADRVFAWPSAEIAVMGADGAAEIIFRKEIAEAENKEAKRKELTEMYRDTFANPYVAGARRQVDDIIDPATTRQHIISSLEVLYSKRELRPQKKHGLIPL